MRIDIVATDSQGRDVLLAEVKASSLTEVEARELLSDLQEAQLPARFGLIGDLDKIRIADFENPVESGFHCVLNTTDILRRYDPEFGSKDIYHSYLETLFEAWLRDIAYRWDSEQPPGLQELASIGLAQRLEGGTTRSEVIVETDPVR
jgi:hypothetical protein